MSLHSKRCHQPACSFVWPRCEQGLPFSLRTSSFAFSMDACNCQNPAPLVSASPTGARHFQMYPAHELVVHFTLSYCPWAIQRNPMPVSCSGKSMTSLVQFLAYFVSVVIQAVLNPIAWVSPIFLRPLATQARVRVVSEASDWMQAGPVGYWQ